MNASFLLHPYSPNLWRYWMAFNDFQHDQGGDPFVGAKLGNLLLAGGFRNVQTQIKTLHLDNREPGRCKTMIGFRDEVLLSAADQLLQAGAVDAATVDGMRRELAQVHSDPNAVFFYSFVQARATVYRVADAGAAAGAPASSRSPVSTVLRGSCQMRCHICASTAPIWSRATGARYAACTCRGTIGCHFPFSRWATTKLKL